MNPMKLVKAVGFWLLVIIIVVYAVFPFYYAILSSMRSGSALFQIVYWPDHFDLANYIAVFAEQPFARNIVNSVIVSVTVVAISLFLGVTAAYALGRVNFRGRGLLL